MFFLTVLTEGGSRRRTGESTAVNTTDVSAVAIPATGDISFETRRRKGRGWRRRRVTSKGIVEGHDKLVRE
jgi:hypothetical protein